MTKTSTRWRIASGIAALTLAVTAMAGASAMAWADDQAADDQAGQAMAEPQEALEASETVTGIPTDASDGWGKDSNGKWYFALAGTKAVGLTYIDGDCYYFDSNGVMQTGWQQCPVYADVKLWYYFASNGKAANGWQKISGAWYYLNEGYMVYSGSIIDDGAVYLLLDNGKMATGTGWKSVTNSDGKKSYYYLVDGKAAHDAWKQIGGKWYYFGSYGLMAKGAWDIYNTAGTSCTTYLFNSNGALSTGGWVLDTGTGYYYYASSKGTPTTGWKKLGNYYYYLDSQGVMLCDETSCIGGKLYHFDANGHMLNDVWFEYDDGFYYAFSDGRLATGYTKIGSYVYDFSEWGLCYDPDSPYLTSYAWEKSGDKYKLKFTYYDGTTTYGYDGTYCVNGSMYYIGDDYLLVDTVGWIRDPYSQEYYYVADTSGHLAANCWKKIDGDYYHFDESGIMEADTEVFDGDAYYRLTSSGRMVTGWYELELDSGESAWYYYLASGKPAEGWLKVGASWYYFDPYGEMETNTCEYWSNGDAYLLGSDGKLVTGNGWKYVVNKYSSSKVYYYLVNGKCVIGWKQIGDYQYFLQPGMVSDGPGYTWKNGEGQFYGFDASGHLTTGWYKSVNSNTWFWFNSASKPVTGFKQISGKWYYFYSHGAMAYDTNVAGIELDSNGHPTAIS